VDIAIAVLLVFWGAAIGLWVVDGPKIPLVFAALWAIGFFGFPFLGVSQKFFMPFEAVLTVFLLITAKYKSSMRV